MRLSKGLAKVLVFASMLTLAFSAVYLLTPPAASGQGVVSMASTHKVIGECGSATW